MLRAGFAAAFLLAAGPAAAQGVAILSPMSLGAQVPEVPPAVDAPLFTKEVWDGLAPLGRDMAGWIATRLPGVDSTRVRELGGDAAEEILTQAVARGYAGSDLFSDRGLRTSRMFFIRHADVQRLFDRYEMRFLTLPSGDTTGGERYEMQGLLLGAGRVVCLYNLSEIEFRNPYFPSRKFKLHDPVIYTIQGDADFGMEGVEVNANLLWPDINRFVKIAPDKVRVETSLGSKEESLEPIKRRY